MTDCPEEPSMDDIVDILVGRMHTHPSEFHGAGVFNPLASHLEDWVYERDNPETTLMSPTHYDFFSDEQKTRLWEGLRESRRQHFINVVMRQVLKPQVTQTLTGAQAGIAKYIGAQAQTQVAQSQLTQAQMLRGSLLGNLAGGGTK